MAVSGPAAFGANPVKPEVQLDRRKVSTFPKPTFSVSLIASGTSWPIESGANNRRMDTRVFETSFQRSPGAPGPRRDPSPSLERPRERAGFGVFELGGDLA